MLERSFADMIRDHVERYQFCARKFQDTFGVRLKRYWDNITGFDVIAFDEVIKPKRNESSMEAVRRQWGDEAVSLICKLIGMKEQKTEEKFDI